MESAKRPGGVVLRSGDGTIHFIRDEVLELTKVTEPEMAEFCAQLLDEKGAGAASARSGEQPADAEAADLDRNDGIAVARGSAVNTLAFAGPFQEPEGLGDINRVASSTVMCPGTMGLADFEVLPVFRNQ